LCRPAALLALRELSLVSKYKAASDHRQRVSETWSKVTASDREVNALEHVFRHLFSSRSIVASLGGEHDRAVSAKACGARPSRKALPCFPQSPARPIVPASRLSSSVPLGRLVSSHSGAARRAASCAPQVLRPFLQTRSCASARRRRFPCCSSSRVLSRGPGRHKEVSTGSASSGPLRQDSRYIRSPSRPLCAAWRETYKPSELRREQSVARSNRENVKEHVELSAGNAALAGVRAARSSDNDGQPRCKPRARERRLHPEAEGGEPLVAETRRSSCPRPPWKERSQGQTGARRLAAFQVEAARRAYCTAACATVPVRSRAAGGDVPALWTQDSRQCRVCMRGL
jgi:hypothetical protein